VISTRAGVDGVDVVRFHVPFVFDSFGSDWVIRSMVRCVSGVLRCFRDKPTIFGGADMFSLFRPSPSFCLEPVQVWSRPWLICRIGSVF